MNTLKTILAAIQAFMVSSALPALAIIIIGLVAIRLVNTIVNKILSKSKLEKAAHSLIKTVIRVVLYGLLALIAADKLGIDVTSIVALASVLTLAVSLAVQNALTNLISGFTLLYTKPFASGDFVEIAGQSGVVQEIGLTYTKLFTADNKTIFIPNSAVTSAQIVNYTALGSRRIAIEVSASYDAPTQTVMEALREAGNVPTRLGDKEPVAVLTAYDDSAIRYTLFVWVACADYWDTLCNVNARIREAFQDKGIEMTYPHLNVHLDK